MPPTLPEVRDATTPSDGPAIGPSSVVDICRALEREYGNPRLGNPSEPLDDLVYIILSTRTQGCRFVETYRQAKAAFPHWDDLTDERVAELEAILTPGGLGRLKSQQIASIVRRLRSDFGHATLDHLLTMSDADAESYLTSLWGVSLKVAKCVTMYTLGRSVLPVDVHVHRVASRLGFRVKKRPDTSQEWIEEAVPPHLRYGFHVNAVAHGRAVCRPRVPKCMMCCVARWCQFNLENGNRE